MCEKMIVVSGSRANANIQNLGLNPGLTVPKRPIEDSQNGGEKEKSDTHKKKTDSRKEVDAYF